MKTGDPIVFVVEDDSSMREALTDLITSVGLLVEPFKSAREFLEHRRRDAPAGTDNGGRSASPLRVADKAGAGSDEASPVGFA
jgi:hypothetical protein